MVDGAALSALPNNVRRAEKAKGRHPPNPISDHCLNLDLITFAPQRFITTAAATYSLLKIYSRCLLLFLGSYLEFDQFRFSLAIHTNEIGFAQR